MMAIQASPVRGLQERSLDYFEDDSNAESHEHTPHSWLCAMHPYLSGFPHLIKYVKGTFGAHPLPSWAWCAGDASRFPGLANAERPAPKPRKAKSSDKKKEVVVSGRIPDQPGCGLHSPNRHAARIEAWKTRKKPR